MLIMKKILQSVLFATSIFALTAFGVEEPLSIDFEAHRVAAGENGKEVLVEAEMAYPGDTIQYKAVYTNTSEEPLKDVRPVIPVPRGMTVVLKSVKPKPTEGSLDGVRFAPMPLLDKEGKPVAAEKIRAFRWHLPELNPNKPFSIGFRVNVDS